MINLKNVGTRNIFLVIRQNKIGKCSNNIMKSQQRYRNLNKIVHYSYLTPMDKPMQAVSINSIIQLASQTMHFSFSQWQIPAQISIILGGIAFRVFIQLCSKLFQDIPFKNHQNRFIYKAIQKLFLIDLNRDIKFYQLDHRKAYLMHQYYKVSYLFKNFITFYLSLNFFRGCHSILNQQNYFSFHLHTSYFPTLASYDPNFLLPIAPMILTYLWITKSRHPFLIHLNREQNLFYRINLAFMSGLIFVPLPIIYSLGYVGLLSGHLLIRKISHEKNDIQEQWRQLSGLNKKFNQEKQEQIEKQKQNLKEKNSKQKEKP